MFKLLIASLTVCLVCGPCSADYFKPIIKESDCGEDDEYPVWTLPTPVNETWLTTMKERIGNAFYRTVEGEQLKTRLECTFLLDDQGNVQDLFVWSSYSSKGTNEEALRAIRTCGPYKNPPDALLHGRRVEIIFSRLKKVEILVDTKDYPSNRERIFQRQKATMRY